jgi:hypothetical protein
MTFRYARDDPKVSKDFCDATPLDDCHNLALAPDFVNDRTLLFDFENERSKTNTDIILGLQ